jgi:hypothetical protein
MVMTVSEYAGSAFVSGSVRNNDVPQEPALAVTPCSSGSSAAATTVSFQLGTRMVRLASNLAHYELFASSTAGSIATSTNTMLVPSGQVTYHGVTPGGAAAKLIAFST